MTPLVFIVALTGIVVSLYLAWIISGREMVPTPAAIYCLVFILFQYPILFVVDRSVLFYSVILSISLISFVFGAAVAMQGTNPVDLRARLLATPIIVKGQNGALFALLAVGFLSMYVLYGGLPPGLLALIESLARENIVDALASLSDVRRAITKGHYFGGSYSGQGVFTLLNEITWQIILVFLVLNRFAKVNNKLPSWAFYIFFSIGLFCLFGAGSKGPVAWGLVAAFIGFTQIRNVSIRLVLRLTLILFVLVFVLVALQPNRYDESLGIFRAVPTVMANRIFISKGNNTYELIVRVISGEIPLRYGQEHITQFLNALPGVQYAVPFANELHYLINPDISRSRTTFATYAYIGSMFLDFGLVGVLFFSFITGILVQLIYRRCIFLPRTTMNLAFFSVLSLHLGKIVNGGLSAVGPLVVVLFFLYGVAFWGSRLRIGKLRQAERNSGRQRLKAEKEQHSMGYQLS